MASPAAGSVVLVKFPFSDLSASKLFSANEALMQKVAGVLQDQKLNEVLDAVVVILKPKK